MQVRKVVQVGLNELRCQQCSALLCQGSTGSVISIVCPRCGTHMIAELVKKDVAVDKPPSRTGIVGMRSPL